MSVVENNATYEQGRCGVSDEDAERLTLVDKWRAIRGHIYEGMGVQLKRCTIYSLDVVGHVVDALDGSCKANVSLKPREWCGICTV